MILGVPQLSAGAVVYTMYAQLQYREFSRFESGIFVMGTAASKVVNFRVPAAQHALIDHAVEVSGMNRTEFILDALCEKAREVLADQTRFELDRRTLQKFNALLDAPLADNPAVRRLLNTPAPWER